MQWPFVPGLMRSNVGIQILCQQHAYSAAAAATRVAATAHCSATSTSCSSSGPCFGLRLHRRSLLQRSGGSNATPWSAWSAVRGYAAEDDSAAAAAAASYRQEMAWESLGAVQDPYTGKKRIGYIWWASRQGWSNAKEAFMDWANTVFAIGLCRRDVPGFKIGQMKDVTVEYYTAINEALANGNLRVLQKVRERAAAGMMEVLNSNQHTCFSFLHFC